MRAASWDIQTMAARARTGSPNRTTNREHTMANSARRSDTSVYSTMLNGPGATLWSSTRATLWSTTQMTEQMLDDVAANLAKLARAARASQV
jgi:hypothetical protein